MSRFRAQSALAVLYPSRHRLALGLILLVGVGLRVAWLAYVNVDPNDGRFDDTLFYYNGANLLARGFGYVAPFGEGGQTAQWPPGYTALLALIYFFGAKGLIAVKALNVGLAMVSIVLTYLLATRVFDRRVGLLAALLLAAFPSYVYLSTLVMAENLFIPAFLLAVLLMVHWGAGGRRRRLSNPWPWGPSSRLALWYGWKAYGYWHPPWSFGSLLLMDGPDLSNRCSSFWWELPSS